VSGEPSRPRLWHLRERHRVPISVLASAKDNAGGQREERRLDSLEIPRLIEADFDGLRANREVTSTEPGVLTPR
jgi:hypothetical protein